MVARLRTIQEEAAPDSDEERDRSHALSGPARGRVQRSHGRQGGPGLTRPNGPGPLRYEGWRVGTLAEIGAFRSGDGFPLAFQGQESGDYPFFKVSDMNNTGNELFMDNANHWISEDARKTLGATEFPAGSIVFAKIGAAIFLERKRLLSRTSCLDNNMMGFIFTESHICRRFFYYVFLRMELGKLVSTTALPSLSGKEIDAISIPIPPPEEQEAIAEALSDVDGSIAALEKRLDKTLAVKQGMMQQLLTGPRVAGMSPDPRPICWIVAGPNGAGKTTFALEYLPLIANCRAFVNADLIAAGLAPLAPERRKVAAGRIFLREIARHMSARQNFGFETTLSGRGHLKLVKRLKADGLAGGVVLSRPAFGGSGETSGWPRG